VTYFVWQFGGHWAKAPVETTGNAATAATASIAASIVFLMMFISTPL
jgi:hypothetical protein